MFPNADEQLALPASSRALRDIFLAALGQPDPVALGGNNGLPAGGIDLATRNCVLVTTPLVTAGVFDDALVRFADRSRRDVVLVRHGFNPETIDPVWVDVALRTSFARPILLSDLSLWRGMDGSLHLMHAAGDLFIEVTERGLDPLLVRPWTDEEAGGDGLVRAAADVVRAVARARSGA